tara:strand:- start:6815 stop:7411 length:597 start_codon:yes stop_codon:yes gene_type:complete
MNISNVIGRIKVCGITLNESSDKRNMWNIGWNKECDTNVLTQDNGRCYFIVVNEVIYKIGYSDSKGGIKNTLSSYKGGNSGRPSDRTHGIHILITQELLKGNSVDIYFTYNENIEVPVKTMDGKTTTIITSISGKHLELENVKLYLEAENNEFPIWNFQEQNKSWPFYIQESTIKVDKKVDGESLTIEDLRNMELIKS